MIPTLTSTASPYRSRKACPNSSAPGGSPTWMTARPFAIDALRPTLREQSRTRGSISALSASSSLSECRTRRMSSLSG
jgi:hypothetical protein